MKHYEDLIERLRNGTKLPLLQALMNEAADAIEELDNSLSLNNCNSCLKKSVYCEFTPRPGQMVRINCPHYLGPVGREDADV